VKNARSVVRTARKIHRINAVTAVDAEDEFRCRSMSQQISRDILKLLIDSCLLGSVGLGVADSSDLSRIFGLDGADATVAQMECVLQRYLD
jgi:hypothetical protein